MRSFDGTLFEREFPFETPQFRHLSLDIAQDSVTGGQIVTHEIEARAPQPEPYKFFAHYVAVGSQSPFGFNSKVSMGIPSSVAWRPGQRFDVRQQVRLQPGDYRIYAGFAHVRTAQRMPLPDYAGNRLPLGLFSVDAPPANLLQRARPFLAARMDTLLDDILAMPPVPGDGRDHLTACLGQAPAFGHVLEFGVAGGNSINHLAGLVPHRAVWGFDTFEGLPEEWQRGGDRNLPAGHFSQNGALPPVRSNVRLVKGLLQDTLPRWLEQHSGNIAFLHVDVDIYSAARDLLELLNDRIVPSTVIVFDDVAAWHKLQRGDAGGYPLWQDGEWKALHEWVAARGRRFALASRGESSVLGIRVLH